MKRYTIAFSALVLFAFFIVACGGEKTSGSADATASAPAEEETEEVAQEEKPTNRRGQLIFKQYCVICHGADGKLGLSGAKDLSISTLTQEERINQVTNGKGLMTPYKDILSEDQIKAVVEYLEELR